MAEEFQESEVIFSDQNTRSPNLYFNYQETAAGTHSNSRMFNKSKKKRSKRNNGGNQKKNHSVPINIPENIFHSADSGDDYFDDEFVDENGNIVPPHLILSRRIAGKMEFSVCTGYGRTLKGRDLSEVRNSILRMTGFLET